uniref:hypothetical protein n=1 Tax=Virgibacillus doumboii TaxID=2697503 RepID=UPI001966F2C8
MGIRLGKSDSFSYTCRMENRAHTSNESIEYFKARTEKLEMENEALEAELKWYQEQFRLSQQR